MQNDSFICAMIRALLFMFLAQVVLSTTTISSSNSNICNGPDAENEVLCATMGAAESAQASPSVEHVTNGVQNMQITSQTSTYSGTVQQVLDQVLSKLKLQEDEIKITNEKLDVLVKRKLIEGLKEQSGLFKMLYKEIAWTGSYYEGLKISNPDEFDLNIVLRMPVKDFQIEVKSRHDLPGYVTVTNFGTAIKTLEGDPTWKPVYNELSKWADHRTGNLLQTRVHQWMEGIVIKFADKYNKGVVPQEQIRVVKSGPAMTLWIGKLSIDVVPVFGFTSAPPHPIKTPRPLNRQWMIVPKPQYEVNGINDAWRVNFYQFEMEILRDYGKIKPAIKLVKKLRDNQTWKSLFSYAIKTVAIWMKESGELSENDKIELAFLKLLRKVKDYLKDGFLPFYWDERNNMLKMSDSERLNCYRRLERLIIKFEMHWVDNPSFIGETIMPESVCKTGQQQNNGGHCTMS